MSVRLLVGTYARNGGTGLRSLCRAPDGSWSLGGSDPAAQNASFATWSERHRLLYCVDEQDEGALGAFRKGERGWEQVAQVATHGAAPCYVALNGEQSLLGVANYGSGTIALFRLDERTGAPREPPIIRANAGSGPVADRQEGPHAHCACFSPDQTRLYHVDLGTDQVLAWPVDPERGVLGEGSVAYRAPAGSGPRHLVFHPVLPLAVLVSELGSTLTVLEVEPDGLRERQRLSTLPDHFVGENLAGHLSVDAAGTRVYATNRGHDSVAVFAWDAAGALRLLQHVPSGGASPRSFVLLEAERQLLVAHEESGNVTAFDLRPDGTLSPLTADIAVPGACFLMIDPT